MNEKVAILLVLVPALPERRQCPRIGPLEAGFSGSVVLYLAQYRTEAIFRKGNS